MVTIYGTEYTGTIKKHAIESDSYQDSDIYLVTILTADGNPIKDKWYPGARLAPSIDS